METVIRSGLLPPGVDRWRMLSGGTSSRVAAVGTSDEPYLYVVKANEPATIAAEAAFYRLYRSIALLPSVRHVDPDHRFIIYDYVPGETGGRRGSKRRLMNELIDRLLSRYQPLAEPSPFEPVEEPDRMRQDICDSASVIGSRLPEADHALMRDIQRRRAARLAAAPLYVLHGDCGVHNFLFADGRLSGVIDPIPAAGCKLYDLLYAFCSSPDELEYDILLEAAARLAGEPARPPELIEDMVLALYSRLSTCLVHHPADWPLYMKAWREWTERLG